MAISGAAGGSCSPTVFHRVSSRTASGCPGPRAGLIQHVAVLTADAGITEPAAVLPFKAGKGRGPLLVAAEAADQADLGRSPR